MTTTQTTQPRTTPRFPPYMRGRVLGMLTIYQEEREKGNESCQAPLSLRTIAKCLKSTAPYIHGVIHRLMDEGLIVRTEMKIGRGGGAFYDIVKAPQSAKESV